MSPHWGVSLSSSLTAPDSHSITKSDTQVSSFTACLTFLTSNRKYIKSEINANTDKELEEKKQNSTWQEALQAPPSVTTPPHLTNRYLKLHRHKIQVLILFLTASSSPLHLCNSNPSLPAETLGRDPEFCDMPHPIQQRAMRPPPSGGYLLWPLISAPLLLPRDSSLAAIVLTIVLTCSLASPSLPQALLQVILLTAEKLFKIQDRSLPFNSKSFSGLATSSLQRKHWLAEPQPSKPYSPLRIFRLVSH